MDRLPRLDFHFDLFKSFWIFYLKRSYVLYFWTKILSALKPQLTDFTAPNWKSVREQRLYWIFLCSKTSNIIWAARFSFFIQFLYIFLDFLHEMLQNYYMNCWISLCFFAPTGLFFKTFTEYITKRSHTVLWLSSKLSIM